MVFSVELHSTMQLFKQDKHNHITFSCINLHERTEFFHLIQISRNFYRSMKTVTRSQVPAHNYCCSISHWYISFMNNRNCLGQARQIMVHLSGHFISCLHQKYFHINWTKDQEGYWNLKTKGMINDITWIYDRVELQMVQVIAQTYRENVLFRKKTGQNISQNMRYRKETSDPTKCCSPIIFTDNIGLKGEEV